MNPNKDYYAILGVLPSIEATALDAVYKSLVKKYHPDVFKGDKKIGEEKTKDINEAYGILRDPAKRKEYDQTRLNQNKGYGSFEQDNNYDEQNETIFAQINSDWEIVKEFYPDAEKWRELLSKLSYSLACSYQFIIITQKASEICGQIGDKLRKEYLELYFGSDYRIQNFAEVLITIKRKDAAVYLNNVIRVLGTPKNIDETNNLIKKINYKFNINNIVEREKERKEKEEKNKKNLTEYYQNERNKNRPYENERTKQQELKKNRVLQRQKIRKKAINVGYGILFVIMIIIFASF
jgi:curved DNA-binding protein CbpA